MNRSDRLAPHSALDAAAGHDEFAQLVHTNGDIAPGRVHDAVRPLGLFVGTVDTGEVLSPPSPSPTLKPLGLPPSAAGAGRRQPAPSGGCTRLLERTGLAWDWVRVDPERPWRKRESLAAAKV